MSAKISSDSHDFAASQAIVVDVFRSFRDDLRAVTGTVPFERKHDLTPVTEWDVAIEQKLKTALGAAFPEIGFVGEETGASGSEQAYWIVDPIDGTTSFIRGLEYSTNMAAFIENGEIQSAVIYDFNRDIMYTAEVGKGAYKNGERIRVNTERREGNLMVYAYSRKTFSPLLEAMRELRVRLQLPVGGIGHAYGLLAEGKIDGIVSIGSTVGLHDVAAGTLIASEAGADIISYDDGEMISRQFIIGTPYLVEHVERSGLI